MRARMRKGLLGLTAIALVAAIVVTVEGARSDRDPGAPPRPAAVPAKPMVGTPTLTLSTGPEPRQRVDLYAPARGGKGRPIVLYLHGGGWSAGSRRVVDHKPAWAGRHNLWFGSIGYRLLPDAPVETQAADVGAALRKVRGEARRHGYDPDRIILMGHSAGAHLAALVATDPTYAGSAFSAIRAVIPVDGACYDVPYQIAAAGKLADKFYLPAFGTDPKRQAALSPLTHAGKRPDAPRWLLIHIAARGDARFQSESLAKALRRGGARAEIAVIPGTHMSANRAFGLPDYGAVRAVDALVGAVIAE